MDRFVCVRLLYTVADFTNPIQIQKRNNLKVRKKIKCDFFNFFSHNDWLNTFRLKLKFQSEFIS